MKKTEVVSQALSIKENLSINLMDMNMENDVYDNNNHILYLRDV